MELDKIYNMECSEGLQMIKDNFIDLTITSPPYDDMRVYNGYKFDFEKIAKELYRVTSDGGVLVWIVGDKTVKGSETLTSFKQALYFKEIGFNVHDTMIYKKDSISFPEKNRYSQIFEYMFVFSKGKPKTVNILKDRKNKWGNRNKKIKGRERQSDGSLVQKRKGNLLKEYGARFNIWEYATGYNKSSKDKLAFEHPAIFPEALARDHILSWSNENDLVMDTFMGSGTVAKMCIETNRRFLGFEISEHYCKIAKQRISQTRLAI